MYLPLPTVIGLFSPVRLTDGFSDSLGGSFSISESSPDRRTKENGIPFDFKGDWGGVDSSDGIWEGRGNKLSVSCLKLVCDGKKRMLI